MKKTGRSNKRKNFWKWRKWKPRFMQNKNNLRGCWIRGLCRKNLMKVFRNQCNYKSSPFKLMNKMKVMENTSYRLTKLKTIHLSKISLLPKEILLIGLEMQAHLSSNWKRKIKCMMSMIIIRKLGLCTALNYPSKKKLKEN